MWGRLHLYPWLTFFMVFLLLYVIILLLAMRVLFFKKVLQYSHTQTNNSTFGRTSRLVVSDGHGFYLPSQSDISNSSASMFTYQMHCKANHILNVSDEVLMVEAVLPFPGLASLQERLRVDTPIKKMTILLMWDISFDQTNLRGCPDWNCEISSDHSLLQEAAAVFFQSPSFSMRQRPNQYFVHYSQESPVNSNPMVRSPMGFFNMSLGFRHDTLASSPYGYAVKLAPPSHRTFGFLEQFQPILEGKKKSIAWFVSHCQTTSRRENVIAGLKRFIQVDVYGGCGNLKCSKQNDCQKKINSDYHFYYAAENSICTDYITEKLWNQGYGSLVVPIVLRRKIVEKYVPPHSFIAVDDYPTIQELALHLRRLMTNKEEYMKYFEWRKDYETVILDQRQHPSAERLWGFCQVCRLTQLKPRPILIIENMEDFWDKSCEKTGEFVDEFLRRSVIAGLPDSNTSSINNSDVASTLSTAQNVHQMNESDSIKSMWKEIT